MQTFDRDTVVAALTAVGRRLAARGLQGDVYLVGGAAMALAYDARRMTADVDAVFEPKMVIYEVAAEVADEMGLPPAWLNDAVKGFLLGDDPGEGPSLDLPGLRVQAASPQMLLALKVVAARVGQDDDDVVLLARLLDLHTADEVMTLVESIAGAERIGSRSAFFVEAAMGDRDG